MSHPWLACWLAVSSALLTLTVSAQTAPAPYRSALEGYQPYSDNKMVPWREANDTVGKVGGWRAYAKEAAEGQTANPAANPAAKPASNPHAGHGKPEEGKK